MPPESKGRPGLGASESEIEGGGAFQDRSVAHLDHALHPLAVDARGVSLLLGISRSLVCKLDATGRLPRGIHLGRRKVWQIDEVRAWLAAGAPGRERWEASTSLRKREGRR